jgi:BlaI family penicillinase repressor
MVDLPRWMTGRWLETVMKQMRLGRMQLQIMKVLWERGSASAREITEALSREKTVAHSTVQTLLRKLEDKGAVRHEVSERTFVFLAAVDSGSVTRNVTRDLIERVFGGSAAGLVAHLLKEERISAKELKAIRTIIDARSRAKEGKL